MEMTQVMTEEGHRVVRTQQGQLARIIGPWTGIPRAAQAWSTEPRTRAAGGYGPSQIEVRPRADALLPLLGQCSRRPA